MFQILQDFFSAKTRKKENLEPLLTFRALLTINSTGKVNRCDTYLHDTTPKSILLKVQQVTMCPFYISSTFTVNLSEFKHG